MKIQILIFLLLIGCKKEETISNIKSEINNKVSESVEINQKEFKKNSEITQNMILGIWTNGSTENATFEIKSKSIYYVDDFQDYSYKLKNDTIEIRYPDYIYRAEILFKNDTLIMNSKEYSQAKYWRFKD
jgi:hypothetical protein